MAGLMIAGKLSKQPYYISELNKNIYSIEELCYFLYNYLYLVDENFFGDKLISYIENVLGNATIAQGIRQTKAHGGKLTDTIAFTCAAAGYLNEKEMDRFKSQLELLGSKSSTERIKAKADILMESGKYNLAQIYYNRILRKGINSDLPDDFYGSVYHDLAVTHVKMFAYESAASLFAKAYSINKNPESLKSLMLCDVLSRDDKKLARDMEKYGVSNEKLDGFTGDLDAIRMSIGEADETDETGEAMDTFLRECMDEYVEKLNACVDI